MSYQAPPAPRRARRRFEREVERIVLDDDDDDEIGNGDNVGYEEDVDRDDDNWYGMNHGDEMASPSLQQTNHNSRSEASELFTQSLDGLRAQSRSASYDVSPEVEAKILKELKLDEGSEAEKHAMSFSIVDDAVLMTWDPILKDFKNNIRGINLLPKPSTKQEAHLAFTYIMDSLGALVNTLDDVTHRAGHEKPVDRLTSKQQEQLSAFADAEDFG